MVANEYLGPIVFAFGATYGFFALAKSTGAVYHATPLLASALQALWALVQGLAIMLCYGLFWPTLLFGDIDKYCTAHSLYGQVWYCDSANEPQAGQPVQPGYVALLILMACAFGQFVWWGMLALAHHWMGARLAHRE
jgi:hypothetical protein